MIKIPFPVNCEWRGCEKIARWTVWKDRDFIVGRYCTHHADHIVNATVSERMVSDGKETRPETSR